MPKIRVPLGYPEKAKKKLKIKRDLLKKIAKVPTVNHQIGGIF